MPKNTNKQTNKNLQKTGTLFYLQIVLGQVVIKQNHVFFGIALIVNRFNLFDVFEY